MNFTAVTAFHIVRSAIRYYCFIQTVYIRVIQKKHAHIKVMTPQLELYPDYKVSWPCYRILYISYLPVQ